MEEVKQFTIKDASKRLSRIKSRCNNKNNPDYRFYGARGVKCKITASEILGLWNRDKAHLLDKPSIDRIDTCGNYEFSNCRFIELRENASRPRRYHLEQFKRVAKMVIPTPIICENCQHPFYKKTTWQKNCSPYCRHKSWRKAK